MKLDKYALDNLKGWLTGATQNASTTEIVRSFHPAVRTYSRRGGEKLLREAAETIGMTLPYNWLVWTKDVRIPVVRFNPYADTPPGWRNNIIDKDGEILSRCARVAGWLRAAGKYKNVRRVLLCTSERGVYSPYNCFNPFIIAARWRSPGQLNRWLRAVRARAAAILEARGLTVPWTILGTIAAGGYRRIGRAAVQVAAATVLCIVSEYPASKQPIIPSYRESRQILIQYKNYGIHFVRLGRRGRQIFFDFVRGNNELPQNPDKWGLMTAVAANGEQKNVLYIIEEQKIDCCRVRFGIDLHYKFWLVLDEDSNRTEWTAYPTHEVETAAAAAIRDVSRELAFARLELADLRRRCAALQRELERIGVNCSELLRRGTANNTSKPSARRRIVVDDDL